MSVVAEAETLALRGLLLIVVEVQNIVRTNRPSLMVRDDVVELVESATTRELVQLAQAALSNPLILVQPQETRDEKQFRPPLV